MGVRNTPPVGCPRCGAAGALCHLADRPAAVRGHAVRSSRAVLSAIGLAVCLRYARRDRLAVLLLAFTVAALVPGFISSTDTPSLLRVFGAPVPLAVLAAIGVMAISDQIASPAVQRWTMVSGGGGSAPVGC